MLRVGQNRVRRLLARSQLHCSIASGVDRVGYDDVRARVRSLAAGSSSRTQQDLQQLAQQALSVIVERQRKRALSVSEEDAAAAALETKDFVNDIIAVVKNSRRGAGGAGSDAAADG